MVRGFEYGSGRGGRVCGWNDGSEDKSTGCTKGVKQTGDPTPNQEAICD